MILWKNYFKIKNTYKPLLTIQYLKSLISLFHKKDSNKRTVIFVIIDMAIIIIKLIAKPIEPSFNQKRSRLARNKANKQSKS